MATATESRLVNVRTAEKDTYIYVGRAMRGRFKASIYGNPFRFGDAHPVTGRLMDRGDAAQCYADWLNGTVPVPRLEDRRAAILADLPWLAERVRGGARLGCWCVDEETPKGEKPRCHGDVLLAWIDAINGRQAVSP